MLMRIWNSFLKPTAERDFSKSRSSPTPQRGKSRKFGFTTISSHSSRVRSLPMKLIKSEWNGQKGLSGKRRWCCVLHIPTVGIFIIILPYALTIWTVSTGTQTRKVCGDAKQYPMKLLLLTGLKLSNTRKNHITTSTASTKCERRGSLGNRNCVMILTMRL